MKKLFKALLFVGTAFILTACAGSESIGERAIIKAIFMDYTEESYEASLVVFTCEPSTDTASVKEKPRVFTGSGQSVEDALRAAEEEQNKSPFYAQNELLFLSENAARTKASEILAFFAREDAQRPNLAVFISPCTSGQLADCDENLSVIVREGERIAAGKSESVQARRLYEFSANSEEPLSAYLPIYRFGAQEDYCGVQELAVLSADGENLLLRDNAMRLLLLLDGKLSAFTLHNMTEDKINAEMQDVRLSFAANCKNGTPSLQLFVTGYIRSVTNQSGKPQDKSKAKQLAKAINQYIETNALLLLQETFLKGNDVFSYTQHLRNVDSALCDTLLAQNAFYQNISITLTSDLKVI